MATYTSTQAGAWNTDATWGGGGHPDTSADIVNIGHNVTYDAGVSAVEWGSVTITAGMLVFPVDSSWKILFGAYSVLTIKSGAEIRTGTTSAADYIGSAYTGQIHFLQGFSSINVMVLDDGGIMNLWGAAIYEAANRYAYLDSEWTSGTTLYVTGDITSRTCWTAGNLFYIHKNADSYSSHSTDADTYTIASIGLYDSGNDRTPVVIDTLSNPVQSCYAVSTPGHESKLILISRNLEISDPGATLGVGDFSSYTERIRFDNNQGTGNENIFVKNAIMSGWDIAVDDGYNFYGSDLAVISNSTGIYYGTNHQVTGDFLSNSTGIRSGTNHQVTGDFLSNGYGIFYGTNHQVTGDFLSNAYGIRYGTNHQVTGDFLSNAYGIYYGTNHQVTGDFLSNDYGIYYGTNIQVTGDFLSNITGIDYGINIQVTGDFDNTTNFIVLNATTICSAVLYDGTISGSNKRPVRIYQNCGDILPIVSGDADFKTPSSANSWIMQATPTSDCSIRHGNRLSLSPLNKMAYYGAASEQTLTFNIYPLDYTTSPDQDNVQLVVYYLSTAAGAQRDVVKNTSQTYAVDGWRSCSVTFTPAQAGIVYFDLHIGAYESGATILIDPIWVVS